MLKNNLKDISNIVLLRSDKILYELLNNSSYSINNKSKSYQHGMQDFYSNSFRRGTLENSMDYTMEKSHSKFTLDYNFKFLDKLFDEYLKIDGNHIYAKSEILDKYSSLISKIHPFNVIGYKLGMLYNQKIINIQNIKEFTKYITPLALNTNRDFKDYADNHIHLGGSNDTALNFLALLSQPTQKEFYLSEILDSLPRINEFSYINNENMSFGNLIDIAKYCVSSINNYVVFKKIDTNISKNIKLLLDYGTHSMVDVDFVSFGMLDKLYSHGMKLDDSLLNQVIKNKRDGYATKQWFLYSILIFELHEQEVPNRELKKAIKIFLHSTNILRSYMVMSQNLGLSHFSEFSRSKFRKLEIKRHNNIASNIIANGTTKVEAKITPKAIFDNEFVKYKLAFDKEIIKKESNNITQEYQKYFLDTKQTKRKYHFSIHFIRQQEKEKNSDVGYMQPRFFSLRYELKKEAKKLSSYLYQESKVVNMFDFYREFHEDTTQVLKHEKYLKNQYIDMSKLITSIDVAGDENRTPPEVFAPILKYLRRDIKKQDKFMSDYIKYQRDGHNFMEHHRLRISVHAGEDFNHIVTGMRKVHESVKFYHMDERDRLGHALAIGLNPKEWCELNGDIFVSKQEHLDNLVWLYHQAIEVQPYYKSTAKLMSKYEKQIKELCGEIYGEINFKFIGLDDLYKAWKLREFCPIDGFNNDFRTSDEYINSVSFNKNEEVYEIAKKVYELYHTRPKIRKKGNEIIKIEYTNLDNNMYKYRITDEDLELYEAIQDRLIQKFCDKGIVIETNPSSNIYIAHIHSYDNHPIFRWNPVEDKDLFEIEKEEPKFNRFRIRTSRMKVCVNTDDPAIMPTTLRNEFDLLERVAFNNHSNNIEQIKKWSEKIRELGIEIFGYDHKDCEFLEFK